VTSRPRSAGRASTPRTDRLPSEPPRRRCCRRLLGAGATFVLALKTRALADSGQKTASAAERELALLGDQAEAVKRQSEVAEAALQASIKPLLIDVPLHSMQAGYVGSRSGSAHTDFSVNSEIMPEMRTGSLTVPVRNVGAGVARGLSAVVTVAVRTE
jgi:hypothetical protein